MRPGILYTPFDGSKVIFKTITEACENFNIRPGTVRNHFQKQRKAGEEETYIFDGGKLERIG